MTIDCKPSKLTLRVYNVGFGDCFLLTFHYPARDRHVLIDFGSTGCAGESGLLLRIAKDISKLCYGKLDAVVATHRHQDHVSRFESDVWEDVEVREVWMPWTEHPTDPHARRIRETQSKVAAHLSAAIQRLSLGADLQQLVGNSLTNAKAMQTLHEGFAGNPKRRFLPDPDRAECSFEPDCLPGVMAHVMGPSRDDEVIRDMYPPVGQSYLRMREAEPMGEAYDAFLTAYLAAFGHAARGRCPLNEIEYGDIKADPLFQPHRLADLAAFYESTRATLAVAVASTKP